MRCLFILDPLDRLDPEWDSSLTLLREFNQRGHKTWIADTPDIWAKGADVFSNARLIIPQPKYRYKCFTAKSIPLTNFDLILIRKEPPFDLSYIYMTYLLELKAPDVAISNHPRGIRNNNEKLSILRFPEWIPPTLTTSSSSILHQFRKTADNDIVIKPLNQKGGKGVFRLTDNTSSRRWLKKFSERKNNFFCAQRFIRSRIFPGDKRIVLLNGEILTAFEKRCQKNEFRANLGRGSSPYPTQLTKQEMALVKVLKPYLRSEGLHLVGLDVMDEQLIEINVTCPGGLTVAQDLYPEKPVIKSWANFLEHLAQKRIPSPNA